MRRHIVLLVLVLGLLMGTSVVAQEMPTSEPPTATPIPSETATLIPSETFTPEPSATAAPIPTLTEAPSLTPPPTETPTEAATLTATASETATASSTASLTATTVQGVQSQSIIVPQDAQACNPNAAMAIASVGPAGVQGNNISQWGDVTNDGRYVAFASVSTNLIVDDTNNVEDVFVYDRLTCQTVRVSVKADGTQGDRDSNRPTISADGRYVTFTSLATTLGSGVTGGASAIYVKDLQVGTLTQVDINPNVTYGEPSITDDGRYIAYWSTVITTGGASLSIKLYDRQTSQISNAVIGAYAPVISGNGQFITFTSPNPNLIANDTNFKEDVFVYEVQTGQITRVSVASNGTPANDDSYIKPSISNDGRYIAFSSRANNLVNNDTNGVEDVFVHDRQTGQTTRVSVASNGIQASGDSKWAAISGDGRYVSFTSGAPELANGLSITNSGAFVYDRQLTRISLISADSGGSPGLGTSIPLSMSADGSIAVFMSDVSSLVPGDTNNGRDVFVAQTSAFTPFPPLPTPTPTGTPTATNLATFTFTPGATIVQTNTPDPGGTLTLTYAPSATSTPTTIATGTISPATCTINVPEGDTTAFIAAINAANANSGVDVICLGGGTYTFSVINNTDDRGDGNALPLITSDITIRGTIVPLTTLTRSTTSGSPHFRFLQVDATGNLTLEWLKLTNGLTDAPDSYLSRGGAIYNLGTLKITNALFTNNSSGLGGAIHNASNMILESVEFSNNIALNRAGALYSGNFTATPAQAMISNTRFTGNQAIGGFNGSGYGGAINNHGTLTITGSIFKKNTSFGEGGSIFTAANGPTVNVTNSCFQNNRNPSVYNAYNIPNFSNNWWGFSGGPSGFNDYVEGNMTTSPALTSASTFSGLCMSVADRYLRVPTGGSNALTLVPIGGTGPFTYEVITQPANGTLGGATAPNELRYNANSGFGGQDSLVYQITDGNGLRAVAYVKINPDLAPDRTYSIPANTPLNLNLGNPTPHGYLGLTGASHGTVTGNLPALVYTGNPGYSGQDSFIYSVITDDGYVDYGTIYVLNHAPSATPAPLACTPSAAMSIASVGAGGVQGNAPSGGSGVNSISADGRYIVFTSFASNLVANDTNSVNDIFLFDRQLCQTTRLSVATDGTQANGVSHSVIISRDGRYIAFLSSASNLVSGDTDNSWDIFVLDRQTSVLTRIDNELVVGSSITYVPSMSAEGRYIVFQNWTGSSNSIELYDQQTAQRTVIVPNGIEPSISANGRFIAFESTVPNLVNGDTNGISDNFVYDRQTSQFERISVSTSGTESNGVPANRAAISADGRYVAFASQATNLVSGSDTNNAADIFVRDRQTSQTTRVSISSSGQGADQFSETPCITDDGRYVAFASFASNLVSPIGSGSTDLYVRDRISGQTFRVPNNVVPDRSSGNPSFTGDGSYITFFSFATNLVTGDTNNAMDAFVAQLSAFVPPTPTPLPSQTAAFTYVAQTATSAAQTATSVAQTSTAAAGQIVASQTAAAAANTLVVNTTVNSFSDCDALDCSLSEAINASNNTAGVQRIIFNIPGGGVKTITVGSPLIISASVIIDASTQPGYNGTPLIELVPQGALASPDGLRIDGANAFTYDPNTSVTIRGLAIHDFTGVGILIGNGQGHLIENNFVGTNAAGTVALGNDVGIYLRAPNSLIRNNLISGNFSEGLSLVNNGGRNANNNLIVGNFIGTDVTGSNPLPNNRGIRLESGTSNNTIGGAALADGNLISGNVNEGILLIGATTSGNKIFGNTIGPDDSGNFLIGNGGAGVAVAGALNTLIGDSAVGSGNDISGNQVGVVVNNGAVDTIIHNNLIAENAGDGISNNTSETVILSNVIHFNGSRGVIVAGGQSNLILLNSIYQNGGLGIDLNGDGVTLNDAGDVDGGGNLAQNFPVISRAVTSGSGTVINGTLNSSPDTVYKLEFFASQTCDASGYGEGQTFLGYTNVATNASGNTTFASTVNPYAPPGTFGLNWSSTFFPTNNLTGTGIPVASINGINFNWGTGVPIVNGVQVPGMGADNFSARFVSTQNFAAGTYTFIASSDDGIRVYIDGALKLDKFVARPLTTDTFQVTLTPGPHNLTVEYFEGIDQASVQFQWILNGISAGFITATASDINYGTSEFSACIPITSVLGIGSYEETNTSLVYSGNWLTYSGAGPKGGSMRYTNDPNAKVSFLIADDVARVTVYRTQNTIYGAMALYQIVGGSATLVGNIPGTGPLAWAQAITFTLPAGTNRTLELRNTSTNYIGFEAFDLLAPPPPPTPLGLGSYEETNSNLTYTGNWLDYVGAGPKGGSFKYSNDPSAKVSFSVVNTAEWVIIYRTQATGYGPVGVYVDGALYGTMPASATLTWSAPYTIVLTPNGSARAIELRNTTAQYVGFEAFDVTLAPPPPTPLGLGSYEETNANLTYTGNWLDYVGVGPKGGSFKYSNDPAAKVSFSVVNTAERVIIYRTQATGYGPVGVYVDGALYGTMPASATLTWSAPYVVSLTPNGSVRTIELRNTSTQYVGFEAFDVTLAPQSLGIGSYEETNVNLTYTGNWLDYVGAGPKGGSFKYSNDPNARVSFKVVNTAERVIFYRTQSAGYGPVGVYVDGVLYGSMPTSTTLIWSAPYVVSLTPNGSVRTIELRNTSTQYVGFEAFDVTLAPQSLGIGSYEETNVNLTYTGNWLDYVGAGPKGGSFKYSNDPNARVSFSVVNTAERVIIYRTQYTGYGPVGVYVDGVLYGSMPTSATLTWSAPYTIILTPNGSARAIELRNTTAQYVGFEAFDVLPSIPSLSAGSYEETNANLIYTGNWLDYAGAGPKGGSLKYSNDPAAKITFKIDNTSDRLVIYRTMALVYGSMSIYIDGVLVVTIPGTNTTVLWQQPYTINFTPGLHTIEVRNTSSNYIGFEAFDLLAPLPSSTATPSPTATFTPTITHTPTATRTPTATPTGAESTAEVTPSNTPTQTHTPSLTSVGPPPTLDSGGCTDNCG